MYDEDDYDEFWSGSGMGKTCFLGVLYYIAFQPDTEACSQASSARLAVTVMET